LFTLRITKLYVLYFDGLIDSSQDLLPEERPYISLIFLELVIFLFIFC